MRIKHTPGPWVYDPYDDNVRSGTWEMGFSAICSDIKLMDANLIVAAPDMYDALECAVDSLKFARAELVGKIPYEDMELLVDRIDKATSALAKADGRT